MDSPWVAGVKVVGMKNKKMIRNNSHKIEKILKDSFPMDSGGQGRRKEKEEMRGLGKKKDTTTIPQKQCQKACWVF